MKQASLVSRLSSRFLLGLVLVASPLSAQQQPTQAQIQQALGTPGAVDRIRQQIQSSGMTPQQIRARLTAAGYSSSLLDAYLSPGPLGAAGPQPTQDVYAALSALGVGASPVQGLELVPIDTGAATLPARVARTDGLQLFGTEVFRNRTSQFQPLLSGPVPSAYRVGPGDVMVLVLTGDVEFAHTLEITREGFVVIPQVGQIYVNGLSMDNLRQSLRDRLARSYSGIRSGTTRFDVTIARLRTNQVFVLGEAMLPGAYQLASVATVMNALYAAGGPTDRGNFRRIEVRRANRVFTTLDLYDYLLRGETANDVILEQGDIVFIPVYHGRVTVTGAVVRPAIYEFEAGQTLSDALGATGGLRPDAQMQRIAVHRLLPAAQRSPGRPPRAAIDVQLGAREGSDSTSSTRTGNQLVIPPLALEDGDSVVVDSLPTLAQSRFVSVRGMIIRPGRYPWQEGMTLKDLVFLARGTEFGADLREAEIARLPVDRSQGQMATTIRVPLDSSYLFERDAAGRYTGAPGVPFPPAGSAPDVVLQPWDNVLLFRQPNFEFQRPVDITGEVAFPGTYALVKKDERLSDLVKRAGGLLPTSYPAGTRFIRSFADAGRVNIDMASIIANPGSATDVILQPGDSILIPEFIPTVRVEGGVNAPTSVLFREGAGLDYYVSNAGGYARTADKSRVSVRFADGSARLKRRWLFFSSTPTPTPGSVVVVPTRPEKVPDIRGLIADMTQIVATLATLVVVAMQR